MVRFKSDLTDAEMVEYVNQNSKDESKDNTSSSYNNEKSSSSKQNDQVHKGPPKKSKSDDESSSELNAEQALEYVSQDSENESKNEASTTDNSQKGCSSKHNDQAYEGSPKKTQSDGCKGTDVKEGEKNGEIDEKSALIDEKGNISGMEQKKSNMNSHKNRGANSQELMPKCKTNVNSDVNVLRRQIFKKRIINMLYMCIRAYLELFRCVLKLV